MLSGIVSAPVGIEYVRMEDEMEKMVKEAEENKKGYRKMGEVAYEKESSCYYFSISCDAEREYCHGSRGPKKRERRDGC